MSLNGPQMAPNGPYQHYVVIISPKVHIFGCFRPFWTTKQGEIGIKSAPIVLLCGLLMALNGPQMAPNGPHQHYVFIISPKVHNLGYFRSLLTRKQGEIGIKSDPNFLHWGL